MADEVKQEEKKTDVNKAFWTFFKVVLGLVLLALGLWAVIHWFGSLKMLFKGSIGLFLILAGVITLAIAKE